MTSRVQHISLTQLSPPSRDTIATAHTRSPTIRPNKNNLTQKRTSKRPRSPEHGDSQRKSTRQGRVGTPPQQPAQNQQHAATYDATTLGPSITPALAPPDTPLPPGTPVFARLDPKDPKWCPARISLSNHTNHLCNATAERTCTVKWEPLESLTYSDNIPHDRVRTTIDPLPLPSINHRALASARPIVSTSIMHIHQTQIKLASDLSKK